ncbi:MAG: outer membrane protein [Desulforhopalus sp.]|jgi:outer membrane protein
MRQIFQAILIAFLLLFGAQGAMAADMKLGVMNVQKIIVECKAGKEAKGRFDVKMKDLQASFKDEEAGLKKLQEEIKKKSSAWSEEKKAEKVREFQKNGRELQAKTEDARFEMKQMQDKELEPILKALEKVVEKYGKDEGYTMILDSKNGVIFFDKTIDLSDSVVKLLDKAMATK